MRLLVKDGVVFKEFNSPIITALKDVWVLANQTGIEMVITSANDSKHMKDSLHYKNLAFDLRTRHMTKAEAKQVTQDLKLRMGPSWDVVLEKDHIHCEYDPS